VGANQNPFPADWKYPVNGEFDPGYRAHQIRAMLSARSKLTPEDMLAIQKDVYSPLLRFIGQQIVRAKGVDPQIAEVMRGWNGQMEKDQAAPMIASLTYQQLRTNVAKRAAGRAVAWDTPLAAAVVERLLRERPKEWFGDWDGAVNTALREAVAEGRRLQGRNPAVWKYGDLNSLELRHPIASQIPWIGGYFNIGPVFMSGSSTTVKQTTKRIGPSMRFVADLSDWDKSLNNIAIGQSGHVLSGHYRDQWKNYWIGKSFPMHWTNPQGDVLQVVPEH
jgi:penicillin amidase